MQQLDGNYKAWAHSERRMLNVPLPTALSVLQYSVLIICVFSGPAHHRSQPDDTPTHGHTMYRVSSNQLKQFSCKFPGFQREISGKVQEIFADVY